MAVTTVLYLLNNTDDSRRIVLQPRVIDGAQDGAVQRSTDLTLYGNGALMWGERFNENFLRLLENFAIAESNLDDQTSGDPYTAWDPRPQAETDAGGPGYGFGINNPIEGQLWFNKSRKSFFVYHGTKWHSIVKVPVTGVINTVDYGLLANIIPDPQPGDLVYDAGALKVWNGTTWVNSAGALSDYVLKAGDTMTGFLTLHSNPTSALHAATKQYVDTRLLRTGDTMTTGATIVLGRDPIAAMDAATKQYVDNAIGPPIGTTDHGQLQGLGDDDHPQYLHQAGDTMTSGYLMLANHPINAMHAATKQYVDDQLGGGGSDMPILLASGTATNGTVVPFPIGYNASTSFIIVSMRNQPGGTGGAGHDKHEVYATAGATGWTIRAVFSRENDGSDDPANANYWVLKNGAQNLLAAGLSVATETVSYTEDTLSSQTSLTAGFVLKSDGTARDFTQGSTNPYTEYASTASTWLVSGSASNYQVLATLTSGSVSGTFGSWLSLGSNRSWSVTSTEPTPVSGVINLQFRDTVSLSVIASITVTFYAGWYTSGGGGGGGGGGSIYVGSYLPFYDKKFGEVEVGDRMLLLSDDRQGTKEGEVLTKRISEQNLLTLVSKSGIRLTCSDNTPLTLEDGSYLNSTDVLGHKLPVQDEAGFRWEEIVEVLPAGRGDVVTVYCQDQCFAAGDEPGRWIWTHNMAIAKN